MASLDAPFTFLPLGAIIQTFNVGSTNIVQGFPQESQYVAYNQPFFGETIGRVANRIKDANFTLNGTSYELAKNNGPNALHGGLKGWGKRVWKGPTPVGTRGIPGVQGLKGGESVKFTLKDEDGVEGYPGTLEASVVYTTGTVEESGKEAVVLGIEYEVQLVGGADETVVNVTNHSYFNLSGLPTIEGTDVSLSTNLYLPVDSTGIPTSGPKPYAAITPNKQFTLGATEPAVDDCFITTADPASVPLDTRGSELKSLVKAYHPSTKIHLEVLSTEPAFQFYTGGYIDVPAVDGLPKRGARSGFCVEPSRYVNAINEEAWKGMVTLKKGEVYGSRIVYKGWEEK